jgi:hypothetical protein
MPKIPVDKAPAGPALDAAVAQVLGWPVLRSDSPECKRDEDYLPPFLYWNEGWDRLDLMRSREDGGIIKWSPSNDIAAAWELALNPPESDDHMAVHLLSVSQDARGFWWARFGNLPGAAGDTTPLAITRAYLLAHGVTGVEVADE